MKLSTERAWMAMALAATLALGAAALRAQDNQDKSKPPIESGDVIKTETRLVVIDAVVTDKKDNYIKDLNKKDFTVFEDGKEQKISQFSFEADPASPLNGQKHYLVLFFDNSTMNLADQQRARQAATAFIDKNAGPNRLMAVVNYGGSLDIAQNFTDDTDRLREIVKGTKLPALSANPANGGARIPGLAGYGARNMVYALQTLAKGMEEVPGRKILVLLTAGMPLTTDVRYSIEAAIAACNKANVAVYPIDVRGLFSEPGFGGAGPGRGRGPGGPGGELLMPGRSRNVLSALFTGTVTVRPAAFANGFLEPDQAGGAKGGGGAGGGTSGGGGSTGGGATGGGGASGGGGSRTGGTGGAGGNPGGFGGNTGRTGGTAGGNAGTGRTGGVSPGGGGGGAPINNNLRNPNNPFGPRIGAGSIAPPFPPFAGADQQAIYMLADGTGGFVIVNTNDLLSGLEKIGNEQNQFYIIGYVPAESAEGSCHTLNVKVDKGYKIRSRSGYCNVKSADILAGKPAETQLETRLTSEQPGNLTSPMPQLNFFYTGPDTARVDLSMDIPTDKIKFEKVKGKLRADVNILGLAYKPDGSVGARFSDSMKLELEDKKEIEKFAEKPLHYESQFDAASGEYRFKIAYSTNNGADFGKMELPLKIDAFNGKDFQISTLLLSGNLHRLGAEDLGIQGDLVDGRTPFIIQAGPNTLQLSPSANTSYRPADPVACYVEIYEPQTDNDKLKLGVQLVIRDKNGAEKLNSGMVEVTNFLRKGNPTTPVAVRVPVDQLTPGSYRLELTAYDNLGQKNGRSANLTIE